MLLAFQKVRVVPHVDAHEVEAFLAHYGAVGEVVGDAIPPGYPINFGEFFDLLQGANPAAYARAQQWMDTGELHTIDGRLLMPVGRWIREDRLEVVAVHEGLAATVPAPLPPLPTDTPEPSPQPPRAQITIRIDTEGYIEDADSIDPYMSGLTQDAFLLYIPKAYKPHTKRGISESSLRYNGINWLVRKLVTNGIPPQIVAEALVAAILARRAITSGEASSNMVDELVRALELEAPSMLIGTSLYKLQKVGRVDGKKYAQHIRKTLYEKAEKLATEVREAARMESESIIRRAQSQLNEAKSKIEAMMKGAVKVPDWCRHNGIPVRYRPGVNLDNVDMQIGITLLSSSFRTVQYLYRNSTYIWEFRVQANPVYKMQAWLSIGQDGRYSQAGLMMAHEQLPHISESSSCFKLDDMPDKITDMKEYGRAVKGFNRSLEVININSILVRDIGLWPAWLRDAMPKEVIRSLSHRTYGDMAYLPLDENNQVRNPAVFMEATRVVTMETEVKETVSVDQAALIVARLERERQNQAASNAAPAMLPIPVTAANNDITVPAATLPVNMVEVDRRATDTRATDTAIREAEAILRGR